MRWPKKIAVWRGGGGAEFSGAAVTYKVVEDDLQRVYVLKPLPKRRQRKPARARKAKR